MNLSHYSRHPFALDRSRVYKQRRLSSHGKPNGFWVSVDGEDDWPSFCLGEQFREETFVHRHRVELADAANILIIDTAEGIDQFHLDYSVESDFEIHHRRASWMKRTSWPLDWAAVARRWDGIIIAPYQWSRRLDGPSWYYTVDCASGCIWNLDAIDSITPAPLPALTAGPR